MSNGTIGNIISSIPRRTASSQSYKPFLRDVAEFLRQPGRAIIISSQPFGRGTHTLHLVFKENNSVVHAETLRDPVVFAERLSKLNIARVVLESGTTGENLAVSEQDITTLINLIMRTPMPAREDLERFKNPHVNIVFKQATGESRVLRAEKPAPAATPPIIAPPARIEVKPVSVPPAPAPTPAAQSAPKELSVKELRSRGKGLNKQELTPALRTEIEAWISAANARIQDYHDRGKAAEFDAHCRLADQIKTLQTRLGIKAEKIIVKWHRPEPVVGKGGKRKSYPIRYEGGGQDYFTSPRTPAATQPVAEAALPAKPTRPQSCETPNDLLTACVKMFRIGSQREVLRKDIKWQRKETIEAGGLKLKAWLAYLLIGDNVSTEYSLPEHIQNGGKNPYWESLKKEIRSTYNLLCNLFDNH